MVLNASILLTSGPWW